MRVGFDFGTTNSSIALAAENGEVRMAQFSLASGAATESWRSLLYLLKITERGRSTIRSWSGPLGIERYLGGEDEKGRLVQSLKSFLSSHGLRSTEVFGRQIALEDLVARIIRDIRTSAEEQFGIPIRAAVVGRPVRFVGAKSEADDEFAAGRLRVALQHAGFEDVAFEYEPVAAAWFYQSKLERDELILIGDFGGGTSDFSLIRVGPSYRRSEAAEQVLGNQGLGLAGDAFDAKIVRHLVSPALGANTELRSGDKLLPVPGWVYRKLERWHHLSLLRSQETLNLLRSVERQALQPDKIAHLLYLIQHDRGYVLHQAVQRVKVELSRSTSARFCFSDGDVELTADVSRAEFEEWIADELKMIERSVSELLAKTGTEEGAVDRVFLTGGSSFVPAVRRIFERRFGAERIRTGDEFTSVARGLALKSSE
ncbi:MAG TPA: Hsp70 family protein [Bryobacteraceae bacterium]|jgi:hypothetical chaperone protein|nr:Hsp70 family protein [Bryobacteraceae bacterium]